MNSVDPKANRRDLSRLGRDGGGAAWPRPALALVDAGAAALFALSLTLVLTRHAPPPALAGLGAALAIRALAGWGRSRLAARRAVMVKSAVRARVLRAALSRRRGDEAALGETTAAAVDEIEALGGYFSQYEPAQGDSRLTPLAIAAAVAVASPIAAGLLLLTLVPFAVVMAVAGGAAGSAADRQLEALSRLSGRFVDRVRALPVILAFEAEARETDQVARAARDVSRRTLGVLRIAFISSAALEFFSAVAVALTAVYAGFALLGLLPFRVPETLDFSRAFFALALAPEFYAPLRRLAAAYHEKQLGEAAIGRLRPLLARDVEAPPRLAALEGPPTVRLEGATLRFGDVDIGPVDADYPAGGLSAIVGPTASGKTSLLAAILGLAPLTAGTVRVAGRTLEETGGFADVAAWAGQSAVFLPGTLTENMMAAAPGVTAEAALAMARRVGLGPALDRRAAGGDTPLDERGSGLSGGERRRLALARALLKPVPLLLLDEPTADLDAVAEAEIIGLILDAARTRTVIVATHAEALAAAAQTVTRLA